MNGVLTMVGNFSGKFVSGKKITPKDKSPFYVNYFVDVKGDVISFISSAQMPFVFGDECEFALDVSMYNGKVSYRFAEDF